MKSRVLIFAVTLLLLAFTPSDPPYRAQLIQVQGQSNLYKIQRSDGTALYKTVAPFERMIGKSNGAMFYETTVFDLRTMSDSAYRDKYVFCQEVPLSRASFYPIMVGDFNHNGRAELYGFEKLYTTPQFSVFAHISEQDTSGIFRNAYIYPDSAVKPILAYDIDQDGAEEVVIHTGSLDYWVYHVGAHGSFPTEPTFAFNPYVGTEQLDDITFGDFDRNGKTDVLYYLSLAEFSMMVGEYSAQHNRIDTVFRFRPPDSYCEGFSVGDFDSDGQTDIVFGSTRGYVYVVECQGVHQYGHVWTGQVETYNAYLHMQTHDIDGNGKPEFWVGGDAYYNGIGETRYTCFEMTGNNSYQPVARIDFLGLFSFFAGNCFAHDIDGDGKEELFICLDQHVLILKFTGSPNHHHYQMHYMKANELAEQNSVYYGATMTNLGGNDGPKLLITMDQENQNQLRQFTRIYQSNIANGIAKNPQSHLPGDFQLFQNYPNPFNSTTVIRFHVPTNHLKALVRLAVYDLLGREITRLLDGEQAPGEHQVRWDGRDAQGRMAGSGVYLIRLETDGHSNTIKALLIK